MAASFLPPILYLDEDFSARNWYLYEEWKIQ